MRLNSKPCGLPHFAVKLTTKFTGNRARDYGIYLAEIQVAHLFLPPLRGKNCVRRHRLEMKMLVRNLLVVVMLSAACVGAFAQKQDRDKRPPKEPVKVVTNDRKDNKPPQNNNQQKPDKQKKP